MFQKPILSSCVLKKSFLMKLPFPGDRRSKPSATRKSNQKKDNTSHSELEDDGSVSESPLTSDAEFVPDNADLELLAEDGESMICDDPVAPIKSVQLGNGLAGRSIGKHDTRSALRAKILEDKDKKDSVNMVKNNIRSAMKAKILEGKDNKGSDKENVEYVETPIVSVEVNDKMRGIDIGLALSDLTAELNVEAMENDIDTEIALWDFTAEDVMAKGTDADMEMDFSDLSADVHVNTHAEGNDFDMENELSDLSQDEGGDLDENVADFELHTKEEVEDFGIDKNRNILSSSETKNRFGSLDDEQYNNLINNANGGKEYLSTKRATATAIRIFQAYLKEKKLPLEFEKMDNVELDKVLARFYTEVRKGNGENYRHGSLFSIRQGIGRHLKANKQIDIIHGESFIKSSMAFKAVLKLSEKLTSVSSYSPINEADMQKLYSYFDLRDNVKLQEKVFVDVVLHLIRQNMQQLHLMKTSDFAVKADETGRIYIYIASGPFACTDESIPDRMYQLPGT